MSKNGELLLLILVPVGILSRIEHINLIDNCSILAQHEVFTAFLASHLPKHDRKLSLLIPGFQTNPPFLVLIIPSPQSFQTLPVITVFTFSRLRTPVRGKRDAEVLARSLRGGRWGPLAASSGATSSSVLRGSLASDPAALRTVGRQAPTSRGFFQQEYWSGLPFPHPGAFTYLLFPALLGGFFTTSATWEACALPTNNFNSLTFPKAME